MDIKQINKAKVEDLVNIEGLDRDRAENIIKFRDENGPFEDWEDLKRIPGFDDDTVDALRSDEVDMGEAE